MEPSLIAALVAAAATIASPPSACTVSIRMPSAAALRAHAFAAARTADGRPHRAAKAA